MPDPVNRAPAPPVDGPWRLRLPWQARCLGCGEGAPGPEDLCAACRRRLPWLRREAHCPAAPALDRVLAAFRYAPPLDRWLPRFKFHRDLAVGHLLSGLMVARLQGCDQPQGLVPVPLHRARLRQRGYDQALELAKPVARSLGIALRDDVLQRRRATAPQSELDAAARARNLRDAFVARAAVPRHVVLLDDVLTTGATLQAAALALRESGAERVDAWVCARVL